MQWGPMGQSPKHRAVFFCVGVPSGRLVPRRVGSQTPPLPPMLRTRRMISSLIWLAGNMPAVLAMGACFPT